MKIAKVECLPDHSGWRKNFVFVRVETDAGVVGWGEAYSQYDRDRAIAAQVEELGRYLIGRDPFQIRHILQTVWHVVTAANEVFVIGVIQDNGTVRGGTGWGAELGRLWSKRVCVFDQEKDGWFRWDPAGWQPEAAPVISRRAFAGIGTMRLTPAGEKAIHDLFERTFGPPPS